MFKYPYLDYLNICGGIVSLHLSPSKHAAVQGTIPSKQKTLTQCVNAWQIRRICSKWKIPWCSSKMAAQLYISQETELEFEW